MLGFAHRRRYHSGRLGTNSGCYSPATIATDRPSVTDSSAVVPNGVFQAENGLLDTDNPGRRTLDFPETLIRVGIGPSTEVRFTAPDYYYDFVTPAGLQSGFGDLAVGMKQQLPNVPGGFQVALVVSLSFPTGAAALSSHGYDPSFQLPWSRKLSTNWTARQECCPFMYRLKTARILLSASPRFFWIDS